MSPLTKTCTCVASLALALTPYLLLEAGAAEIAPQSEEGQSLVRLSEATRAIAASAAQGIVTVTAYERIADRAVEAAAPGSRWMLGSDEYADFRLVGSGSGILVGEAGDVLTNRHILLKPDGTPADLVDVETVDNRHTISTISGMEPTLNLAVVRIQVYDDQDPPEFRALEFADSITALPGDIVFAIGDPFGPDKFFTQGFLASTPSRLCYQEQLTAAYMQAVLPMHTGAFGGALLDVHGRFLGMLTPKDPAANGSALDPTSAVRYALPSNIIQGLYKTIARNASFESPWLGYAVMSLAELRNALGTEGMAKLDRPRVGIYIENVFEPSPAFAAGIRPGDFLARFDGQYVGSPLDFQKYLYLAGIGSTVELEMYRAGETFTVQCAIETRPQDAITR